MNKAALFGLAPILTAGALCMTAHAAEANGRALDIAPFALPGTPANEVRFEEPREIREVVVTLKSAVPGDLGLSYLHKNWRRERQELLDPTIKAFQMGWKTMDDWFDVSWDKGAVRVEKRGSRTAILRFDQLSKEGVSFRRDDVEYRYALGIRVDGVPPEAVVRIEVRTASTPGRTRLRVLLVASKPASVREVAVSGHNCEIARLIAETGTKRLDATRVRLLDGLPARRSFLVEVRHLVSSHRFAHDEGLVTFDLSEKTFTVSLDIVEEMRNRLF